jgi:hypothetical protein
MAILMFAVCLGSVGCGVRVEADDRQFNDAIARLDKMLAVFEKALLESKSWRDTLATIQGGVKADAQELLNENVTKLLQSTAADVADIPKEAMDYAEVKIRDNLRALFRAIKETRAELELAKNLTKEQKREALDKALLRFMDMKVYHDVTVRNIIPDHIIVKWNEHDQRSYNLQDGFLDVRGWGFERPPGESLRFPISIYQDVSKKTRTDDTQSAVHLTAQFKCKIDLASIKFQPGDSYFRVQVQDKLYSIKINHTIPPAPKNDKIEIPPPSRHPPLDYPRTVAGSVITPPGVTDSITIGIIDNSTFSNAQTPAGRIVVNDKIDGRSTVTLFASAGGTVVISRQINGQSKVYISAKYVELNGIVDGEDDTEVVITIPPDGSVKYSDNCGTIRINCPKTHPGDPEPSPGIAHGTVRYRGRTFYNGTLVLGVSTPPPERRGNSLGRP